MKLVSKIAAGVFLGIGLPITLLALVEVLNSNTPSQEQEDAVAALVFFGLPATALGG